jgi:hypothetical protein
VQEDLSCARAIIRKLIVEQDGAPPKEETVNQSIARKATEKKITGLKKMERSR